MEVPKVEWDHVISTDETFKEGEWCFGAELRVRTADDLTIKNPHITVAKLFQDHKGAKGVALFLDVRTVIVPFDELLTQLQLAADGLGWSTGAVEDRG